MPKANLTEIEARELRIKKKIEQREHAKKLRELEKKQEAAKEEQRKKEQGSKKLSKPEDYDKENFIIREAELDEEREKRLAEKKKKFDEEFKPDFDIDEVPPLE